MKKEALYDFLSSIVVIIIGLLIGLLILLISDASQAFTAFGTILTSGFSSMRNLGDVLLLSAPIILTGLSVAFAFKTGLFNIGASGQFTIGGFTAVYISLEFTFIPAPLRIIVAILAATFTGALWGAIPGLLKAYRNVHEVIGSIMTNYIGMLLVNHLILTRIFDPLGTSRRLESESTLPTLGFENIFTDGVRHSHINMGILIAIAIAILIYVVLEKTTFGYELKACGFNKDAAEYAGINAKRNIVYSMMISGALAGLAGAINFMGGAGLAMGTADVLAPEGFVGISVAFLALSNPIGVIFSGLLISYLTLGGSGLQGYGFSFELIQMVIAIIIYFCAFVFLVKSFLKKRALRFSKLKEES